MDQHHKGMFPVPCWLQGIKAILKAFQPSTIKMYLINWPVSGVIVSMQAMTNSHPKVPDVQNPSHYVLGSGSGRLWLSRGAAVNNYFNFIHHLRGACEAVEQALKKKCWISERAQVFPWPPRSSFAVLAVAVFPRYLQPVNDSNSWTQA